jgi:hypothetical protein
MTLHVVIAPTDVSFYRVTIYEVGQAASSLQGWYATHPAPSHIGNGADQPMPLPEDNSWTDNAYGAMDWLAPGWSIGKPAGSFIWLIPVDWQVGGAPKHRISGWQQDFSLASDGRVVITKFGHSAERSPDQSCSTLH